MWHGEMEAMAWGEGGSMVARKMGVSRRNQVCLLKCLKLGQLHVMMVWLEKPRRSGVADALHSANSNTRSSGFSRIYALPWIMSLLRTTPQLLRKCGQGMFIFLGENIHFVKGHGVGKGVE